MRKLWILAISGCSLFGDNHAAHAENFIVGVNVTNNDGSLSASFQDEAVARNQTRG